MSKPFADSSRFYDYLYDDKNSALEAEYVSSILHQHGIKGNKLLEYGAGTGRHSRELSRLGYTVDGIDLSPSMISRAPESEGVTLNEGDIRYYRTVKRYSAVLALFHVVSYLQTNSCVLAAFNNVSKSLDSGGIFLFDFWYLPAVLSLKPQTRTKRVKTNEYTITRFAHPLIRYNENLVDVNYRYEISSPSASLQRSFDETHVMRYFSLPEIHMFLQLTGFKLLTAEEWLTKQQPSDRTWGLTVLAKKV